MAAEDQDRPQVGYTGARFGGGARRRARPASSQTPAERVADLGTGPGDGTDGIQDERPAVGMSGARFGGTTRRKRSRSAEPPRAAAGPVPASTPPSAEPLVEWPLMRPAAPDPEPEPGAQAAEGPASVRVRPYVLTGGRTRAGVHLEVETLVSAGPYSAGDHQHVVELCRRPVSVAEVAALMDVPIGVARVVVGDLAGQGALVVHAAGVQDVPELAFLERVLTGLRRL